MNTKAIILVISVLSISTVIAVGAYLEPRIYFDKDKKKVRFLGSAVISGPIQQANIIDWRTEKGKIYVRNPDFTVNHVVNLEYEQDIEHVMFRDDKIYVMSHTTQKQNKSGDTSHGGIYLFGQDGKLLKRSPTLPTHHFFDIGPDGSVVVLTRTYTPNKPFLEEIIELSPDLENITWRWNANKSLLSERDRVRLDWCHPNHIAYLPATELANKNNAFKAGNILYNCYKEEYGLMIIDRQTGQIAWRPSTNALHGIHWPTLQPNGEILSFRNGLDTKVSRLQKVNPITEELVWEYTHPEKLFSHRHGSAQQLPNGNIFSSWGDTGRVLEITQDKQIVMEVFVERLKPPEGECVCYRGVTRQISDTNGSLAH